ncbi:hypothetical protein GURASL_12130 [Geotalea uraniireducens]|uniref:Uncharacterized protein n=1 Tax=Geotalea uraniireducens TaxID=351604 RepID=A0ABN6VT40_9BACT|nr:hypothetical protein GURASL_12130 [Geotalea uraniireducens]
MAGPVIRVKRVEAGNDVSSQRIEMNVPNELQKVGIFLADDRLVPILEEMPASIVSEVEDDGVTGQQPTHKRRKLYL